MSHPVDYEQLLARLHSSEQWDRVLRAAMDWLKLEPSNSSAHMYAAEALTSLNRFEDAQTHLEKVLAVQPDNDFALNLLSLSYFEQGQFQEADQTIQQALDLSPNSWHHWYNRAYMCLRRKDMGSSRHYASRALELNPRDGATVNLLTVTPSVLVNPFRNQQRLEHLKKALELAPENPDIHRNLGLLYQEIGNAREAILCFRRALHFDPTCKRARRNLIFALESVDCVTQVFFAPIRWIILPLKRALRKPSQRILLILTAPIWFSAAQYLLGATILWSLLALPMYLLYRFIRLGDVRAKAGELGARRGGIWGYRAWALWIRLGVYGVCVAAFWGGAAFFATRKHTQSSASNDASLLSLLLNWWTGPLTLVERALLGAFQNCFSIVWILLVLWAVKFVRENRAYAVLSDEGRDSPPATDSTLHPSQTTLVEPDFEANDHK